MIVVKFKIGSHAGSYIPKGPSWHWPYNKPLMDINRARVYTNIGRVKAALAHRRFNQKQEDGTWKKLTFEECFEPIELEVKVKQHENTTKTSEESGEAQQSIR